MSIHQHPLNETFTLFLSLPIFMDLQLIAPSQCHNGSEMTPFLKGTRNPSLERARVVALRLADECPGGKRAFQRNRPASFLALRFDS